MDSMLYLQKVGKHFVNQAGEYEYVLQTFEDFKAQKIDTNRLVKRLTKLFQGQKSLILGFNEFLPKHYKIVQKEDEDKAITFIKRVETAFKNDCKAFIIFLGILDMYMRKDISIIKVYKKISDLFCDHQELLLEFGNFLPDTSVKRSILPPLDIIHAKKKCKIEEKSAEKRVICKEFVFFDKVKATLQNSDICQELAKCVELYNKEIISRLELQELVDDLIGEYPELVKGLDEFLGLSEKHRKSNDICLSNSIEDLDLSKCEEISPSYRLLPKNYYKNIGVINNNDILNDECKCVAPIIDEFKHRHISKYEDKMFECEDEMFELDMKLQHNIAAVQRAINLMEKMRENPRLGKNSFIRLEMHFKKQNLMCIKRLFAKKGPNFLENLSKNAQIVLPIVLDRLIVEEKGLQQILEGSKKRWKKHLQIITYKCSDYLRRLCNKNLRDILANGGDIGVKRT